MSSSRQEAIGGYFGLETGCTGKGSHYPDLFAVNSGRNALGVILQVLAPSRLFIPYYTCDVVLEPLKNLGVPYSFYHLNEDFTPTFDVNTLGNDDYLLYNNYFGVCSSIVTALCEANDNIIIDNSQAFYSRPVFSTTAAFYSPRKYFGVADGGYAFLSTRHTPKIMPDLDIDQSWGRMSHLLKRLDLGAEAGFADFQRNDQSLSNEPLKSMSRITRYILESINYDAIKQQRLANYQELHFRLAHINQWPLPHLQHGDVPMIYPLLVANTTLRKHLIDHRVFVSTYWPNISEWLQKEHHFERHLQQYLLPLPIDQRYDKDEMQFIINLVNEALGNG